MLMIIINIYTALIIIHSSVKRLQSKSQFYIVLLQGQRRRMDWEIIKNY